MAGRGRGKTGREKQAPTTPGGDRATAGAESTAALMLGPGGDADLHKLTIDSKTVLAPKLAPGSRAEQNIRVVSNMYKMEVDPGPLHRYEIVIRAIKLNQRELEITRGARNDYFFVTKRNLCYEVYTVLVKKVPQIFSVPFAMLTYDRMRILYSKQQLDINEGGTEVTVSAEEVKNAPDRVTHFVVKVSPVREQTLELGDFSKAIETDLELRDRSLQQALELISSQVIFFRRTHLAFRNKFYEIDGEREILTDGRYLLDGIQKNVRIVEGDGKTPTAVLQTDLKKTAMFSPGTALEHVKAALDGKELRNVVLDQGQIKKLHKLFKDMAIRATHNKREFLCSGVTSEPLGKLTFRMPEETRIVDYFKQKHGIELMYHNLPCLVERNPNGASYHPIELCEVLDYQRVPIDKQTDKQQQAMIKKSALLPRERMAQINKEIQKVNLHGNEFLKANGISVSNSMMSAPARVLPPPTAVYKQEKPTQSHVCRVQNGHWNMRYQKFNRPAECQKWVAVSFVGQHGALLERFIERLKQAAAEKGMSLGAPVNMCEMTEERIGTYLKTCLEENVRFVLFISPNVGGSHDCMKFYEQQYGVQTQDVKFETVNKMMQNGSGAKVMDNFLMKINLKLGGINHMIELESPELTQKWLRSDYLYVGLDVNHPPPLTKAQERRGERVREPSVVGLCANTGEGELDFTGDYAYQETRSEAVVTVLKDLMAGALEKYKRNHGDKLPSGIVFFRDGVSDGQYKMVLQREEPQIRAACTSVGGAGHGVKLTILVVQKRHNGRIFLPNPSGAKAADQNIRAGTVVDRAIVHPTENEFYLNSHRAIQGTARTPKYVVLVDDNKFSSDDIQGISYALSYAHQIVTQSVSLPAPVFGAHVLAKRGKDNYRVYINQDCSSSSSGATEPDFTEASIKLGVRGTQLEEFKFWA